MAGWSWRRVHLLALLFCVVAFVDLGAEARGRSRGRASSGRSRNRVRSTSRSTRSSSSWRHYGGLSYKSAAAAGMFYGFTSYQHRRRYLSNPDDEPTICVNHFDYRMNNGTYYQYFICPGPEQPDSYHYCCGQVDRQHCCTFWDGSGRVAGVVIGIIVFVIVLACGCYFCCFKRLKPTSEGKVLQSEVHKMSFYPSQAVSPPYDGTKPPTPGGLQDDSQDPLITPRQPLWGDPVLPADPTTNYPQKGDTIPNNPQIDKTAPDYLEMDRNVMPYRAQPSGGDFPQQPYPTEAQAYPPTWGHGVDRTQCPPAPGQADGPCLSQPPYPFAPASASDGVHHPVSDLDGSSSYLVSPQNLGTMPYPMTDYPSVPPPPYPAW